MAGPFAAAIPASALAATAAPILSFRSEQVMRIAASIMSSAEQPEFAAARHRLGHKGRDLPSLSAQPDAAQGAERHAAGQSGEEVRDNGLKC
jgi:hypothetical protein